MKLIGDLYTWKEERDALIHHMAKIPYDHESIKATAIAGQELVKMLSSKVRSVNAYYEKQNSTKDG